VVPSTSTLLVQRAHWSPMSALCDLGRIPPPQAWLWCLYIPCPLKTFSPGETRRCGTRLLTCVCVCVCVCLSVCLCVYRHLWKVEVLASPKAVS
jgi:hypothetical protein